MPGALQGRRCRKIATSEPRMANSFAARLADALETSWPAIARANQLPPADDWQVWLLLAGRGFGKTRTLAEWVCQQAASGEARRIALVAATAADARDVLVEGQRYLTPFGSLDRLTASSVRLYVDHVQKPEPCDVIH